MLSVQNIQPGNGKFKAHSRQRPIDSLHQQSQRSPVAAVAFTATAAAATWRPDENEASVPFVGEALATTLGAAGCRLDSSKYFEFLQSYDTTIKQNIYNNTLLLLSSHSRVLC